MPVCLPEPTSQIGCCPSLLPAEVVVFIQINVEPVQVVVFRSSQEKPTLIAVCLVDFEHASMDLAPVDVVSSGVNSKKEELFAAHVLLFESCCEVSIA